MNCVIWERSIDKIGVGPTGVVTSNLFFEKNELNFFDVSFIIPTN